MRCDGLVVATPQGSTGYNLANGGPVLAWGVRGFVVSFIAPHSLTARALVVAPDDLLTINNASREEPVEVHVDGRPACELPAGEDIHVEFGALPRDARAAPRRELLPPPARALRTAGEVAAGGLRSACDARADQRDGAGGERARRRRSAAPHGRSSRSPAARATPASSARSSPARPRWGRSRPTTRVGDLLSAIGGPEVEAALHVGEVPAGGEVPRGRRLRPVPGGLPRPRAARRLHRLLSWLPFAEGVNWKRIRLAMLAWKDRNRSSRAMFEIAHRKEIADLERARPRGCSSTGSAWRTPTSRG